MKPLHKSVMIWTTTIMGVLSVLQQQAQTFPPLWAAGIAVLLAAVVAVRQWLDATKLPETINPIRAMLTSLPLWCSAGMAAATALQQYTIVLPQQVATALTTVLMVLPVIARGNAALYVDPPPKPLGGPDQAGFVRLDVLAMIVLLAVIALSVPGCSAPQWPKGCTTIDREGKAVLQCKCAPFGVNVTNHPTLPRPAGTAGFSCNGEKMPIEVQAENVGLPTCRP